MPETKVPGRGLSDGVLAGGSVWRWTRRRGDSRALSAVSCLMDISRAAGRIGGELETGYTVAGCRPLVAP